MQDIRRRHHIIPQFYLKGFCDGNNPNFIWVYTKGKPYKSGRQHYEIYSPCLTSTRIAGAQIDFYSNELSDGSVDYDSVEKQLEKLERPSQPIIDKIRNRVLISDDERLELTKYMMLIFKRAPYFRSDPYRNWDNVRSENIQKFLEPSMVEKLAARFKRAPQEVVEEVNRIDDYYQQPEGTKFMYNKLLFIPLNQMMEALYNMNWTFALSTGRSSPFITSDAPIYFSKEAGLRRSDLTFPISKEVALLASWKNYRFGFYDAPENVVKQINNRTARNASKFLFAPIDAKWLSVVANKILLFPHSYGMMR